MYGGERMPNYKEMYLTIFRASKQAVDILIAALRDCEEIYISSPEPELIVLRENEEVTGEE